MLLGTSTTREVAKVLGNLETSFEAVAYGRSFYRSIEIDKIIALKLSKGRFDGTCIPSPTAMDETRW